jgi:hypothetical protein
LNTEELTKERHNLKSPISSFRAMIATLKRKIDDKVFCLDVLGKLETRCDFLLKEVDRIFIEIDKNVNSQKEDK